jgi:hypothetical protein
MLRLRRATVTGPWLLQAQAQALSDVSGMGQRDQTEHSVGFGGTT